MRSLMVTRGIILILTAILTLTAPLTMAEEGGPNAPASPDLMAADMLLARPAGVVATVLGSAIFIVGLPFTLISGSTDQAAQQLMQKPANYTFSRPMGQDVGGLGNPQH
ncbi:MAG TPA: hypothetical protein PKI41_07520 [Candidatus Competibacteraceae bacterium]|nr:hypothetical protein [Candidatus Competibacteraceae bacterium]HQA25367.1 hypothetical protein [Candidatus Competibacteraceae bacterium]HQD56642.1 hypothetical protein [Candidatus Competibacteraceae bacterium]